MSGLQFQFKEVIDEIEAMRGLVDRFAVPQSIGVLHDLRESLRSFQDSATSRRHLWQILESKPFVTQVSRGGYELAPRVGARHVHAVVTCLWEIGQVRTGLGQKQRPTLFELSGNASTRVRILDADIGELADWRVEIGASDSPGCHFHTQIRGQNEAPPFPKSLSVPRLPTIHVTPLAVIEYVICELFQDEWDAHVAGGTPHVQRWREIQRKRFDKLLRWSLLASQPKLSTPWVALKRSKPDPSLFAL